MADWFSSLGQTIAGGIATAVTFGQVEEVNEWTAQGAKNLVDSTERPGGKMARSQNLLSQHQDLVTLHQLDMQ